MSSWDRPWLVYANACIDISDGLLADLGHVLKASGCGARIEIDKLPYAESLAELEDSARWNYQLSGGDDYELLFTLPPHHKVLTGRPGANNLGINLSIIGEIEKGEGVRCISPDGTIYDPQKAGFEHFSQKP